MNINIIIFVVIFVIILCIIKSGNFRDFGSTKEGYRDPIYLNRAKMVYDWYPRANGSIYGFSYKNGGSWNLFSGYPYYDRAY